jgi:hypothetical protein
MSHPSSSNSSESGETFSPESVSAETESRTNLTDTHNRSSLETDTEGRICSTTSQE